MKTLREKLRQLRLHSDKKQEELADVLGVKQQQYSKMERGAVKRVSVEHLQMLSKFYNISVSHLLDE